MADNVQISAGEFGAAFKGFLEQAVSQAPAPEPVFLGRLRDHLEAEPTKLAILTEGFDSSDHPNLQAAIEAYLGHEGRSAELVGVIGHYGRFEGVSLFELVRPAPSGLMSGAGPTEGPVEYINVHLGDDRILRCIQAGLLLIRDGTTRLAVLVSGPTQYSNRMQLQVEVISRESDAAERFLADLRTTMRRRNVY